MLGTDWKKGTTGRVYTPHRSDGLYNSRAKLVHDSPADARTVKVKLLEDFYCCEAGEVIKTKRSLFRPDPA